MNDVGERMRQHVGRLSALDVEPERQFLNYALPCLENREARGTSVLRKHALEIRELATSGTRPRRALLRFVFPDAYRGIGKAAAELACERWSHAAVEHYFLIDHNDHVRRALLKGVPPKILDLCMVKLGWTAKAYGTFWDILDSDGSKVRAIDAFHLSPRPELLVAIHGGIIVDVLREELICWERDDGR